MNVSVSHCYSFALEKNRKLIYSEFQGFFSWHQEVNISRCCPCIWLLHMKHFGICTSKHGLDNILQLQMKLYIGLIIDFGPQIPAILTFSKLKGAVLYLWLINGQLELASIIHRMKFFRKRKDNIKTVYISLFVFKLSYVTGLSYYPLLSIRHMSCFCFWCPTSSITWLTNK